MDLQKKTVIIQWNVRKKDLVSFASKLITKIPDPSNIKEYYQSLWRRVKQKKWLEIITRQPKSLEISNIVDIKSAIIEHPKTFHKLSKTIIRVEKVS